MLINLKPRGQRTARRPRSWSGLRDRGARRRRRHALPAADAGPDHRRRGPARPSTGCRSEGADTRPRSTPGPASWSPRWRSVPQVRNVTTDAARQGLSAFVDIDRDTAARLAITAATVDDALYSAFGQRIVSTIFTETNQYRVILEADPSTAAGRRVRWASVQLPTTSGGSTPLSALRHDRRASRRRCRSPTWRSSRPPPSASTPRPASRSAPRSTAIRKAAEATSACPPTITMTFLGAARRLRGVADQPAVADPGGGGLRLHRAGRALRELHPPADDPVDPALGRRRRAAGADDHRQRPGRDRHHRHHPADRHRQEERDHDDRLRDRRRARARARARARRSTRRRCCASGRS